MTRARRWTPIALASLLLACEPPERLLLPRRVAIVVQLKSRDYASLLVDLDAPRRRPAIRVAQGLVLYDGDQLIEIRVRPHLAPDGILEREVEVQDLLHDRRYVVTAARPVDLDDRLDVVSVTDREALLSRRRAGEAAQILALDLASGELREVPTVTATERFERFGPDRGFSVHLDGDRLLLSQPHEQSSGDVPLLDQTDHVVAVRWIAEEAVPAESLDLLRERFKAAGSVVARAQDCTVDGDLSEWSGDEALAVGGAGNLERGASQWQGVRDASFALAARLAPHALCIAVRVRDDHVVAGEDLLVLDTRVARFDLALPDRPESLEQSGIRAAFTDRAPFGVGVELSLAPGTWIVEDGHVPLRVLFHDLDPGDAPVVMASAPDVPWASLAGVRLPRRGRSGALPPR